MKQRLVRVLLGIVGLGIALLLIGATVFQLINRTNGTLVSSGERREYLLHVPERYDPAVPTPLVISIHGYAEWPAHQMQVSRWDELADEHGFLVVFPSGTSFPLRWRTQPGSMQDVTFIADLIDELEGAYNIDPNRIYANGLSNGGGMSFVLSCHLSERIAAVGLVAGAYLYPWEQCSPARPVPAIVFHGTEDPIVPFQGGPSRSFDLPFPQIDAWVGELARHNHCAGETAALPASGAATGVRFTGCAADVLYYTVDGGGHSWPGGEALPEWIAGTTTQDIDATRLMWAFFQAHPLTGE